MAYETTLAVINLLTALSTVVTNATVFNAIVRTRRLHNPSNVLLCSLTISDVAVGLIVQPLFVSYVLGCRDSSIRTSLVVVSMFFAGVSLLTMAGIAVDRFLAVYFHLRYRTLVTMQRTFIHISALWFQSLAFVCFLAFLQAPFLVKTTTMLVCNVVLMSIVLCCYIFIHKILRRHKRQIQAQLRAFNVPAIKQGRSLTTMFYIHGIFILSGMPLFIMVLYLLSIKKTEGMVFNSDHIFWASTIVFLNSFINPYVYCWRMRDVRRAVLTSLGWRKHRNLKIDTITKL